MLRWTLSRLSTILFICHKFFFFLLNNASSRLNLHRAQMTGVRTILVGLLSAVAVEAKKKNADQVASSKYPTLAEVLSSSAQLVTTPTVLATLLVAFTVLGWSVRKKDKAAARGVVDTFLREMLGLIIMVCCTFTPGPFLGNVNGGVGYEEWLAHCFGVMVSTDMPPSPRPPPIWPPPHFATCHKSTGG